MIMNGFLLPFELNVEIRTYHNKAFPLGIIKANIDEYDKWICNKFINCIYRNNSFDSMDDDVWSVNDGAVFIQNMWVSPSTLTLGGIDVIKLNENMLQEGNYITGLYNEFYIPSKGPYQKENFIHDYVIFGYDKDDKVFKSAAYLDDKQYRFFDIRYDDYLKAVTSNSISKTNLNYIKVNREFSCDLKMDKIIDTIDNYINSRRSSAAVPSVGDEKYGIDVWNKLAEYIQTCTTPILDYRFGRVYMEHHNLMMQRLLFLKKAKYICCDDILREYKEQIVANAQLVHNLFIKYNISKKESVLSQMIKIVKESVIREEKIMSTILNMIKI